MLSRRSTKTGIIGSVLDPLLTLLMMAGGFSAGASGAQCDDNMELFEHNISPALVGVAPPGLLPRLS